jgi:hypothetical protein
MKRWAFCLRVRGFTRLTIRETLALGAFQGARRTIPIGQAQLGAVRITEIELRQIAVQVCL